MNNGRPIDTITNYERICLIRNDLTWIKRGMLGIGAGIILNIIINLMIVS